MLRYYFNGPASISLYERLQQILTCNMVRGMVILNILIVFLISILDIILVNMPYMVGNLALIFIILCVYTGVITGVSGHWNKQKQRICVAPSRTPHGHCDYDCRSVALCRFPGRQAKRNI